MLKGAKEGENAPVQSVRTNLDFISHITSTGGHGFPPRPTGLSATLLTDPCDPTSPRRFDNRSKVRCMRNKQNSKAYTKSETMIQHLLITPYSSPATLKPIQST
jgi:hypothetical protein